MVLRLLPLLTKVGGLLNCALRHVVGFTTDEEVTVLTTLDHTLPSTPYSLPSTPDRSLNAGIIKHEAFYIKH